MASDDMRSEDQPLSTDEAHARAEDFGPQGALITEGDDTPPSESYPSGAPGLAAALESALADDSERGLETRRQKALIAAALFDEPVTPVRIGRFTIVRELGAGGMGVVYVAYDEQLDRRVAVKLLRGASPSSDAPRRLEREAQAMARLSHPHVVTVHEVGTFEGQVFVAMEFVDGQDLRGWLKSETRTWREVIDVFRQAVKASRPRTTAASCIATSSPTTCSSARTVACAWPTSGSPMPSMPRSSHARRSSPARRATGG
jgi:hypothetical protein